MWSVALSLGIGFKESALNILTQSCILLPRARMCSRGKVFGLGVCII